MLRLLNVGYRNFVSFPDPASQRLNWEVFAALEGKCAPRLSSKPSPRLQSSKLWLLAPREEYHWISEDRDCYRILFHFAWMPEVITKRMKGKVYWEIDLSPEESESLEKIAKELLPHYHYPNESYSLHIQKAVSTISLMFLSREKLQAETPLHLTKVARIQRAEAYYRDNLKKCPSINEIARHVNISPSQLRRTFHEIRQKAPREVFRDIRLHEACRLLRDTNLTTDVIAVQANFNSIVDFHRSFKKKFFTTPHKWRTEILMAPPPKPVSEYPKMPSS